MVAASGATLIRCWSCLILGAAAVDLKLGYLYIQGGPSAGNNWGNSWVQESFAQFRLGIQDVNSDPSVLQNYTLTFDTYDTKGDEATAALGAFELTQGGAVGLLGTGYSSAVHSAAVICSGRRVPMVSPGSTAIHLSDKSRYPFFLRSIATDGGLWKMAAAFVHDMGWRRVGMLVASNEMSTALASQIIRPALSASGVRYLQLQYEEPIDSSGAAIPQHLAKLETELAVFIGAAYRVLLVTGKTVFSASLVAAAEKAGMDFSKHVWLLDGNLWVAPLTTLPHALGFVLATAGATARKAWFETRWPSVTTLWNASIHGGYDPATGAPFFDAASVAAGTIWDTDYAPEGDGAPDLWGSYVYDTVWLFAHALERLTQSGGDPADGAALRSALLAVEFEGITGNLSFDAATQDRVADVECYLSARAGGAHVRLGGSTPNLFRWAFSGPCNDCTTVDVAAIPWAYGEPLTDGREISAVESWVSGPQQPVLEGDAVSLQVHLRDASGLPPCRVECEARASADCTICVQELLNLSKLRIAAVDASRNASVAWAAAPRSQLDVSAGMVTLTLDQGFTGSTVEDRTVRVTVELGSTGALGQAVITLHSGACHVGHALVRGSCAPCAAGEFAGARGLSECEKCGAGTFQAAILQSECNACPRGTFQAATGASACERCGWGEYAAVTGASACAACPAGRTTEGTGFVSIGECLCPPDTYEEADGACRPCSRGMRCRGYGAPPQAEAGYYLTRRVGAGASVFDCEDDTKRCPGGGFEVCAPGRTGIACGACQPGTTPNSDTGGCSECKPGEIAIVICTIIAVVLLICSTYHRAAATSRMTSSFSAVQVSCVFSQVFMMVQVLGVMSSLTLVFTDPVRALLRALAVLNLSFGRLHGDCLIDTGVVGQYAGEVSTVPALLLFLVVYHFVLRLVRGTSHLTGLANAAGLVMLLLYVAYTAATIAPLHCTGHPNGEYTMPMSRSTVCWSPGDHGSLLAIGLVALALPIAFFAVVVRAAILLPKRVSSNDLDFVSTYSFIFLRFSANRYWFAVILMSRNLAVALVPMLPTIFWQSFMLQLVLQGYLLACLSLQPWRSRDALGVDVSACCGLLTIMLIAALVLDNSGVSVQDVSIIAMVVLAAALLVLVGVAVWVLARRIVMNMKKYGFFLCHQKSSAGAFARLLHCSMQSGECGQCTVFLDSDCLFDLDTLFTVVQNEVRTLVVLCTPQLLQSAWCVGEITTATANSVPILPLLFAGYEAPDDTTIQDIQSLINFDILTEQGVAVEDTRRALLAFRQLSGVQVPEHLTETTYKLFLPSLPRTGGSVARRLGSLTMDAAQSSTPVTPSASGPLSSWLVADHGNTEAVAASLVLRRFASKRRGVVSGDVPTLLDTGSPPSMPPHGNPPPSAQTAALILFTVGCFESRDFFVALATLCTWNCHTVLPIVTSDGFRYPSADTYQHIRRDVAAFCKEDGVDDWSEPLVSFLGAAFKKIACQYSIMSDSLTLSLQTDTILLRADRGGKGVLLPSKSMVVGGVASCHSAMTATSTNCVPAPDETEDKRLPGFDSLATDVPDELDGMNTFAAVCMTKV